jgi:polyisoprenoid-binding protein YceI
MKLNILTLILSAGLSLFGQQFNLDLTRAKVSFYFHGEKVNGSLAGLKATVNINIDKPEQSEISGSVDVSTISTGNKIRDKHLMSNEYFDAAKFPLMTFKAKSIKKDNDDFVVTGVLKIKDIEREEKFTLSVSKGVLIFKGTMNSADYGIMKKKKREYSQVDIIIEIPFI